MDTRKLVVGQDVFMRSGGYGDWGKVVEATTAGVIVQSDPCYGAELIRFDKNGIACDSSDISIYTQKNIALFHYERGGAYPVRDNDINSEYRKRFWESFERLKKHSRYRKIPGTECGPWKLYPNSAPVDDAKGNAEALKKLKELGLKI